MAYDTGSDFEVLLQPGLDCGTPQEGTFHDHSYNQEWVYLFNNKMAPYNRSFETSRFIYTSKFRVGTGHMNNSAKSRQGRESKMN